MYLGVIWLIKHFPGTIPTLEPALHIGLILTPKIAIFWTPPAPDRYLERAKMAPRHHPTCVTSVWVRSVPKVNITVVLTAKRVTKKAKK